jgi:hypothetical protein
MTAGAESFDAVLKELAAARLADDEIQSRDSSVEERTASRVRLEDLRSRMALLRSASGNQSMPESQSPESGIRLG